MLWKNYLIIKYIWRDSVVRWNLLVTTLESLWTSRSRCQSTTHYRMFYRVFWHQRGRYSLFLFCKDAVRSNSPLILVWKNLKSILIKRVWPKPQHAILGIWKLRRDHWNEIERLSKYTPYIVLNRILATQYE